MLYSKQQNRVIAVASLLAVLLMCVVIGAHAAAPSELNTAIVPVADRSPQALQASVVPALRQVLIKLSGQPNIIHNPTIEHQLADDVSSLVDNYSYSQHVDLTGAQRLMVTIVFNQQALEHLLQRADQPLWSAKKRPQTLIWIKVPADLAASSTLDQGLHQAMHQEAQQRGVSILFPEKDLMDRSIVGADQGQLYTLQAMQQLSKRYGVPAILVGSLSRRGDGLWLMHWKLLWQGQSQQWQQQGDQLTTLVTAGVDRLVDQLAQEPSSSTSKNSIPAPGSKDGGIVLNISGVNNLHDYSQVMNYFRHLSIITHVSVSDMNSEALELQVDAIGGQQALVSVLATSTLLRPLFDEAGFGEELRYHWQSPADATNQDQPNARTLQAPVHVAPAQPYSNVAN